MLDRHERFVIRSTGDDSSSTGRMQPERGRAGRECRLRYPARIVKIEDGKEKTYDLRYGVEPIRLAGRRSSYTWWL